MASVSSTAIASRAVPIDPGTRRICTESGISLVKGQLITLKELETGLKLSVKEAELAEKSEAFWGKALVAARFTKATCDVIIDVMAEWIPSQKAAGLIKKGYDQKDFLADASAGKVDIYKISKTAIKETASVLAKKGKISGEAKTATDEISKRVDIVKDGLTGKLDGDKIRKYITDGHFDMAEKVMKEFKGEVGGKAVRTGKAIFNYSFEVITIVNDRGAETKAGNSVAFAKRNLLSALKRIQQKISDLESEINACEMPELEMRLGLIAASVGGKQA